MVVVDVFVYFDCEWDVVGGFDCLVDDVGE